MQSVTRRSQQEHRAEKEIDIAPAESRHCNLCYKVDRNDMMILPFHPLATAILDNFDQPWHSTLGGSAARLSVVENANTARQLFIVSRLI
jgi:hypothetical protein